MGHDWPVKTVAECAAPEPYSTQIGPFGKALMADEYTASGVPVLRGVNVNLGCFHDDDFVFISDETADRLAKFESHPGDVLLVHKGTLGQIGLMPKSRKHRRYIMGNSMLRVRCDPAKLLPEYLYYWLSSADGQDYLFSRVSQVGVPQLQTPLATLRQAALPVPPLREQHAITQILGALDDKIELNRRMVQTLHEVAWTTFVAQYLSHPERQDWPLVPLGEHVDAVRGLSYTGAGLADDGIPFHNLDSVYEGGGYKRDGIKWYVGEYKERHLVRPGDVIVANTEQGFGYLLIAYPAIVPKRFGETGLFSHHLYRVHAKTGSRLTSRFLYFLLLRGAIRTEVAGYANGTTVNMLPRDAIERPRFHVPPVEVVHEVDALTALLDERAELAEDENETLADLRDTLLPKLISGEMRVGDAEEAVETAS